MSAYGELIVMYDDGMKESFYMYDVDIEEFVCCFPSICDYEFKCLPDYN